MLTIAFPMNIRIFSLAVLTLLIAVACGPSSGSGRTTTALQVDIPERVTDENVGEMRRLYQALPLGSDERGILQERLLAYIDADSAGVIAAGDYDALVSHFQRMTSVLSPDDFESALPQPIVRVAVALAEAGAPRGDEGRVLAALRIRIGGDNDEAIRREYQQLVTWGRDARANLPTGFERFSGLLRVWERQAQLAPAPEVLQTVAQLHVERRDSVLEAFRDGPETLLRMGPLTTQVMRLAPLDVAAVFLRHGDVASAITHVRAMADGGETAIRVLQILEQARGDGGDAADALVELGEAYREPRPSTGRGICAAGLRRFRADARFPTCLARISAEAEQFDDATAWYAAAIDLAPDVRGIYDEALQRIDQFLERGMFDQDASQARALAHRAERILDERMRRFPNAATPVPRERIELLVGTAEMHAGNAEEATRHFQASLNTAETSEALLQLGLLKERTGSAEEAVRHYRRALDLTPNAGALDAMRRARILEHLGDAFSAAGNTPQSSRMYRQSLASWDELRSNLEDGPAIARVSVRRGVILDHLGQHDDARAAFRGAMTAAPQMREVYASILSHLVAASTDLALAQEVFRTSQRQLTLAPEWKVYFALWVKVVAARAGGELDTDVTSVLRENADAANWSGKLARFGVGDLPYRELLAAAEGVGEETEAHFYEAARRLAQGDLDGARELFRRVLRTNMVGFYEFTMARALLDERE
ncbi:MAG: tetratricopeptide repeat protein [Myxococcota bacterium]